MGFLLKFKNKFSKEKLSRGLDIGTSTLKYVELRFTEDTVQLDDFNLGPVTTDLAQALKAMTQIQPVRPLNLSVSGPATVIRYVEFPRMNESELRQSLNFEAPKHIPFPIAEVNLDACILRPDLPDNKMLVLLAAVKKDFISQRLNLIQELGLKANIVDIDSLALINAFNFNYSLDNSLKNKAIALLNIGASFSNLNILENELCRLSRDIHIAGNNFTQRIADTLGSDFKSAEGLKIKPAQEKSDKIRVALESALSNLANELRTSFDYYESQSASTVAKIFLSGGGSQIIGLKDMLANLLGIAVEYWDPLREINLSDNIDTQKVKALSSQLAVAVGLALRS